MRSKLKFSPVKIWTREFVHLYLETKGATTMLNRNDFILLCERGELFFV